MNFLSLPPPQSPLAWIQRQIESPNHTILQTERALREALSDLDSWKGNSKDQREGGKSLDLFWCVCVCFLFSPTAPDPRRY